MPIYNSKNYLKQSIDSVINQSLNFRRNIQLILIDDGSIDDSIDICTEYQKKYPKNIIILSQEHKGVASTRNLGLKYAKGKYINFLDSDDYLSRDALENVEEFFKVNSEETDVVALPIYFFERTKGSDSLNYKFNKTRTIDLVKEPNNPQISLSSSFMKRSAILNSSFDENLIFSEDTLFLNKILLKKKTLGVLENSKYFSRERYDRLNRFYQVIFKKEFYIERFEKFYINLLEFSKDENGVIPRFIQYMVLYDLLNILKMEKIDVFDNDFEFNEFKTLLLKTISYIDDEVILNNQNIKNNHLKNYIFYLKKKNQIYFNFTNQNNVFLQADGYTFENLKNRNIWLNKFNINEDFLEISGFLNTILDINNLSINLVKDKNNKIEYYDGEFTGSNSKKQIKFLLDIWEKNYNFNIKVPIEELYDSTIKIVTNYFIDGDKSNFKSSNLISSYLPIKFGGNLKLSNKDSIIKDQILIDFNKYNNQVNAFKISKLFKFSIVMAIYNTEDYLNEAIDSIINQTLGFEENVQLILIDDGSIDSSKDICLDYKEKYPDNIVVLSQKNSGQATARNNGLKYVKGKYVNFLDSDDKLSENALEEVYNFFEKHYNEIDLVALPMIFFGRKEEPHMLNAKFNKTRVIDLEKEPNNPLLTTSAAFFKREVFDRFKFPINVSFSEDSILVNKLLMEKKKYGVINSEYYYYRKREDLSSTIDNVSLEKDYFTDKLKFYYLELISYCLNKEKNVPEYIQYTLAYDLQWMLKEPNLDLLESKNEKSEFWFYLDQVISYLNEDSIINNKFVTNSIFIPFFYYLKKKDLHVEYNGNNVSLKINDYQVDKFSSHNLWIDIVSLKDEVLTLAGFVNSNFDIKNVSFEAVKEKKTGELDYFIGKYIKYTPRVDVTFLDKKWQFKNNFEIKIPLSLKEESKIWIKIHYHKDGDKTNYDKENLISKYLPIKFSPHARLSEISNYLIKDSHMVIFNDNTFFVWPYTFKSMLKREYNARKKIRKSKAYKYNYALNLRLVYLVLYPFLRNRKIYLYMDRPDVADDNAMHLFKYAVNQKEDIKKYFIISKECDDYKLMSKIGNVLDYRSFKHKLLYLFADKVITTHPYETIINPFFIFGKDERKLYNGLFNPQIYFLQHGVTKDNISGWLTKYDKDLSLIVTVSEKERESFFDEGYAFDEDVVQVLGFPRYDNLKNDNPKKEILIIPTWRKYLRGNKGLFLNSDYFKSLNSILSNEELIETCENMDYKIVFKPHPELDMFIGDSEERYRDLLNIHEKIKLSTEETYQELFNSASVLVTDYSSVFFDFAYMKKPVIFYHPHDDYHYTENYFDYETMGFGEVIIEENDLINKIKDYISKDCIMEEKYKRRVDDFFKYTDRNNCQRVHNWIKEH